MLTESDIEAIQKDAVMNNNFEQTKEWLRDEPSPRPTFDSPQRGVIPILHNSGQIILQFCGWSVNLNDDGTWHSGATDGD